MSLSINTSSGSSPGEQQPAAETMLASGHEPNLSHIAPGLRALAVPVTELSLMVGNPRCHPTENLEAIKAALAEYGQVETILVNRRKQPWEVIHGNGRLQAALELGWSCVAANIVDVDDATAKAMAVVLNRTGELAKWDKQALDKILGEVRTSPKLAAMLAELAQKQGIAGALGAGLTDPDSIPQPPDEAVTQPGDIWLLGNHRVKYGDSGNSEHVDQLLDGAKVELAFCDPPYGVNVEPRSQNAIAAGLSSFPGAKHHQRLDAEGQRGQAKATPKKLRAKDRPLINDFLPEEEFNRLLRAWFANIAGALEPGRAFYILGGYGNLGNYPPALKESGLYFSQCIVWDKMHPVLTRKDFMGAFELAFYGWKEGAAHTFLGPNNATDLWQIKKVNPQNMSHLTEKPVELAVRALQYSTRPNEHVLDLFGGSGSTLIAAEQTGRRVAR